MIESTIRVATLLDLDNEKSTCIPAMLSRTHLIAMCVTQCHVLIVARGFWGGKPQIYLTEQPQNNLYLQQSKEYSIHKTQFWISTSKVLIDHGITVQQHSARRILHKWPANGAHS